MIQEEVQKFALSKRAAAFNTINKVWENELKRIGAHIPVARWLAEAQIV